MMVGEMSNGSNAGALNSEDKEMADVVFDLDGTAVPDNYAFALWSEVVQYLPWLKDEENAGILPLRGSASGERMLLSKRTKLVLRVPVERVKSAAQLSCHQLNIDGSILTVGQARERSLQAATTLHAHIVESDLNEVEFIAEMNKKLQSMNISCNLICDKHRKIRGDKQSINGFGLVLHDLKPAHSLHIQRLGLGGARHFGCGLFVPFKAITGLD